jgi:hypothetical protein
MMTKISRVYTSNPPWQSIVWESLSSDTWNDPMAATGLDLSKAIII